MIFAVIVGIIVVFVARYTLANLPKVKVVDAIATGGLFGAVSGSTMAAGLTVLEEQKIPYEAWAGALYPFMDIPALVTAIVVANIYLNKKKQKEAAYDQESFSNSRWRPGIIPISRIIPAVGRVSQPTAASG